MKSIISSKILLAERVDHRSCDPTVRGKKESFSLLISLEAIPVFHFLTRHNKNPGRWVWKSFSQTRLLYTVVQVKFSETSGVQELSCMKWK